MKKNKRIKIFLFISFLLNLLVYGYCQNWNRSDKKKYFLNITMENYGNQLNKKYLLKYIDKVENYLNYMSKNQNDIYRIAYNDLGYCLPKLLGKCKYENDNIYIFGFFTMDETSFNPKFISVYFVKRDSLICKTCCGYSIYNDVHIDTINQFSNNKIAVRLKYSCGVMDYEKYKIYGMKFYEDLKDNYYYFTDLISKCHCRNKDKVLLNIFEFLILE